MKKILLFALLILTSAMTYAVNSGSWYAITINGKGIIIPRASLVNNTQLEIWTQTNVPSQLWQCVDNGDGTISLKSGYLTNYLCRFGTVRAGARVTGRTEATKRNYGDWVLKPVEGKADTYKIATTGGKCVVGVSSKEDEAVLTLVDPAVTSAELTEWTFTEYTGYVPTSFDEQARDAVVDNYMAHYYHNAPVGHVLGNGGFWGDAEMFETILDAFETTGNKKYQTYITELIKNFTARKFTTWRYNSYNDDITWMVLACIRAYKFFDVSAYKTYAKKNFDLMYERAVQPGGSLRWKEGDDSHYGSNSCINCPATVAACYLYEMTGDESYLEKAKSVYAFQRAHLFNSATGQVYDSGSWNESWSTYTMGNAWASTYNQGTMLGAATKLYLLTGDEMYKRDADKVWEYTYNHLTNNFHIVHVCQTATGDLCGFKGILMRYVRLYGQTFDREDVFKWMEKNAWFALQNANSKGVIWSKWLTKTTENFKDGDKNFYNDAFGASTAVSVAFNAHVNRRFKKDAYSLIGAEVFDDIQFMQISDTMDDDNVTPNTTKANKGYICFKNVDFGSEGATNATLRLYSVGDGSGYELYVDRISPDKKIGTVQNVKKDWNSYDIEVTKTAGVHTLYAVPTGSYYTMFHNIIFSNSTNGISRTETSERMEAEPAVYNLAGQRLAKPQKGINIINGRKVVIK